jgi:hypothetical protein
MRALSSSLLFEITNAAELSKFVEAFWYRSPIRLYGISHEHPMMQTLEPVLDAELVRACPFLDSLGIRFIAERDPWGFFPNVLLADTDLLEANQKLHSAAQVLSSPLQSDDAAFKSFPMKLP